MLVSDVAVKDQVMVCVIRLSGFFDWLFVGVHGGPHRCCLDELNLRLLNLLVNSNFEENLNYFLMAKKMKRLGFTFEAEG